MFWESVLSFLQWSRSLEDGSNRLLKNVGNQVPTYVT